MAWKAIENHPVISALILIGGIGGGVTTLVTLSDEIRGLFAVEDLSVVGEVCPNVYTAECFAVNSEVQDQLQGLFGETVDVDLEISWVPLDIPDIRLAICDADFQDRLDGYLGSGPPGWTVMEIAAQADDCFPESFIAFPDDVMAGGLIQENDGGAIYRIKGTFLVGQGELAGDNLPSALHKGFMRFQAP